VTLGSAGQSSHNVAPCTPGKLTTTIPETGTFRIMRVSKHLPGNVSTEVGFNNRPSFWYADPHFATVNKCEPQTRSAAHLKTWSSQDPQTSPSGLQCGCGNFLFKAVTPAGFLHKLNFQLSFTSGTAYTKLKVVLTCVINNKCRYYLLLTTLDLTRLKQDRKGDQQTRCYFTLVSVLSKPMLIY
jgi:hypothetical protein